MVQVLPALNNDKHVIHSQTNHEQGKNVVDWPVEKAHGGAQPEGHGDCQVGGEHP